MLNIVPDKITKTLSYCAVTLIHEKRKSSLTMYKRLARSGLWGKTHFLGENDNFTLSLMWWKT